MRPSTVSTDTGMDRLVGTSVTSVESPMLDSLRVSLRGCRVLSSSAMSRARRCCETTPESASTTTSAISSMGASLSVGPLAASRVSRLFSMSIAEQAVRVL